MIKTTKIVTSDKSDLYNFCAREFHRGWDDAALNDSLAREFQRRRDDLDSTHILPFYDIADMEDTRAFGFWCYSKFGTMPAIVTVIKHVYPGYYASDWKGDVRAYNASVKYDGVESAFLVEGVYYERDGYSFRAHKTCHVT